MSKDKVFGDSEMTWMENLVTCGSCFCVYQAGDRDPLVLPCGHNLCCKCMSVSTRTKCIVCPSCKIIHKGLVMEELHINRTVLQLVEKKDKSKNSKCNEHSDDLTNINEQKILLKTRISAMNDKIKEKRLEIREVFYDLMGEFYVILGELCRSSSSMLEFRADVSRIFKEVCDASKINHILEADAKLKDLALVIDGDDDANMESGVKDTVTENETESGKENTDTINKETAMNGKVCKNKNKYEKEGGINFEKNLSELIFSLEKCKIGEKKGFIVDSKENSNNHSSHEATTIITTLAGKNIDTKSVEPQVSGFGNTFENKFEKSNTPLCSLFGTTLEKSKENTATNFTSGKAHLNNTEKQSAPFSFSEITAENKPKENSTPLFSFTTGNGNKDTNVLGSKLLKKNIGNEVSVCVKKGLNIDSKETSQNFSSDETITMNIKEAGKLIDTKNVEPQVFRFGNTCDKFQKSTTSFFSLSESKLENKSKEKIATNPPYVKAPRNNIEKQRLHVNYSKNRHRRIKNRLYYERLAKITAEDKSKENSTPLFSFTTGNCNMDSNSIGNKILTNNNSDEVTFGEKNGFNVFSKETSHNISSDEATTSNNKVAGKLIDTKYVEPQVFRFVNTFENKFEKSNTPLCSLFGTTLEKSKENIATNFTSAKAHLNNTEKQSAPFSFSEITTENKQKENSTPLFSFTTGNGSKDYNVFGIKFLQNNISDEFTFGLKKGFNVDSKEKSHKTSSDEATTNVEVAGKNIDTIFGNMFNKSQKCTTPIFPLFEIKLEKKSNENFATNSPSEKVPGNNNEKQSSQFSPFKIYAENKQKEKNTPLSSFTARNGNKGSNLIGLNFLKKNISNKTYLLGKEILGKDDIEDEKYLQGTHNMMEHREARLTWQDGRILMHCLSYPSDTCFSIKMPSEVFLELKVKGVSLGHVYIRLWCGMRRAQQFLALCLGHLGQSYLWANASKLFPNQHKECLAFKHSVTSEQQLLRNLEFDKKHMKPLKEGYVIPCSRIISNNAKFRLDENDDELGFAICTRDDPDLNLACAFGKVVSGMDVVRKALNHKPVSAVTITQCGLVMPHFTK